MEICGEHGADIAFTGRDCPACEEIDKVRGDKEDLDSEIEDMQSEMDKMQVRIDELEGK